jgi:uncharacterized BrkB/YihY/UPF0761 family membrane protein
VATSLLFNLGRFLIGLYLGRASFASAYGVAGSFVLLFWVYYSAQVVLLGAEFTQVYARVYGEDSLRKNVVIFSPASLAATPASVERKGQAEEPRPSEN